MTDPLRPRLEYSGMAEKLREALKDPATAERFVEQTNAIAGGLRIAHEARSQVERADRVLIEGVQYVRVESLQDEAFIERLAEVLFLAEDGLEGDFEKVMGFKRKLWKTDAPWDSNPDELAEHQRDDYRGMARAAVALIRKP